MQKFLLLLISLVISQSIFSQPDTHRTTDSIVTEGKRLYRSEMASWYGTDIFLERFKEQRANIGGYFSYNNNLQTNCIFFSKGENPKVIGTIIFDSTYNVTNALVDGKQRDFTPDEQAIFIIRKIALSEVNKDTLFKRYQNTNLNFIPLIENGEKKVYILTGPQVDGFVVLGNDYLLNFDADNKLVNKKQLHKNIIAINYNNEKDKEIIGTMHNHLPETGDFITATDICTLLLYEKFTKWEQHIVLSKNYVSIWDCKKNVLTTLTREAWEKIYKEK